MSNPHIVAKARCLIPIIVEDLCLDEGDVNAKTLSIIAMTIAYTQNTERREDLSNDMIMIMEHKNKHQIAVDQAGS